MRFHQAVEADKLRYLCRKRAAQAKYQNMAIMKCISKRGYKWETTQVVTYNWQRTTWQFENMLRVLQEFPFSWESCNCHLSKASTFNAIQGQMLSAQTTVTWVNVCYITTFPANVFPCSNLRINSFWHIPKKHQVSVKPYDYFCLILVFLSPFSDGILQNPRENKVSETQPVTALLNKSLEGRWHHADKSNLRSPLRIDRLLSQRPILHRSSDTLHLLTGG